jgi:putative nucleotidyltransferase with HDIG domain
MAFAPKLDPAFEGQCRRIAAWSMALERAAGFSADRKDEVVDLAEALDAHFGWEPFSAADDEPDQFTEIALACLQVATSEDLDRAIQNLPVFPLAAQRALGIILGDDWSAGDLESMAGSDQALAAHLLRAANSWTLSPRQPIVTIPHAITYIGAERACRILYAAAVKPLFGSPRLRDVWHHSLAAAEVAESLAEFCHPVDRKKAFLAGLIHDIGGLAMTGLPPKFHVVFEHLTASGCEPILAERAISGFSHAQAGARALRLWNFAPELSEAVEFHHAPEKSDGQLASLLYLTEQWTDSSEDAPSAARFRFALDRMGLTEDQFEHLSIPMDRTVAGLHFD